MGPRRWLLILAVLAVLVLVAPAAAAVARDLITRGARLTATELDDSGDIPDDPAALAAQAADTAGQDVSVATYTLARMLRSEAGNHGPTSKLQRAHAALNDARNHFGGDVVKCITASSRGQTGYGSQSGRRYSTAQDPYENDLAIAEQAEEERAAGTDRAAGAEKFVNTSALGGVQPGTPSYDALLTTWGNQGFAPVDLPDDNDEPDLVFFAKVARA
jgi:hypothetical protein